MNRLSQTLHLCFFCFVEDFFELNCPIIDGGVGGIPPLRSSESLSNIRDDTDSMSV